MKHEKNRTRHISINPATDRVLLHIPNASRLIEKLLWDSDEFRKVARAQRIKKPKPRLPGRPRSVST